MYRLIALSLFILVVFSACAMSPENQQAIHDALWPLVVNGSMSQEQFDTIMAAIGGNDDWWMFPLNTIISVGLAYFGINSRIPLIGRGRRTQVHGLPATKIQPPNLPG